MVRRFSGRTAVLLIGEVALTVGVLLAAYTAYTLWGSGLRTEQAQESMRESLQEVIQRTGATGRTDRDPAAADAEALKDLGSAYGILRIPRFGEDWEWVVVDGVEASTLRSGPGRFPESDNPGELGNFAIAGHRTGYGAPFGNFEMLQPGDEIELLTPDGRWEYRIDIAPQVIDPQDLWAVESVPDPDAGPDAEPTERRMTLTTCWPRLGTSHRMYASAVLHSGPKA